MNWIKSLKYTLSDELRSPSLSGTTAASFTLKDLNGRQVSLSDFRGRIVVLHFWATWVEPCRPMVPYLNALHQKYRDRGLVVIGMSNEEDHDKVKRFAKEQISYTVLLDAGEQFEDYGIGSIPWVWYVDRDGIICYGLHWRPQNEKTMERVERQIESLLNR